MEKTAIFVDVQNIYYTVKEKYDCHFNYNVFWVEVTKGRKLVKAIAYATDKGDNKQIHFQNILQEIGFTIKLKPFIQRKDGSTKGDWDVGITVDMLEYAKQVDTIVLASGDGDYVEVVEKVIDKYDVSVEVYGVPGLTSSILTKAASLFIPIQEKFLLSIPETW